MKKLLVLATLALVGGLLVLNGGQAAAPRFHCVPNTNISPLCVPPSGCGVNHPTEEDARAHADAEGGGVVLGGSRSVAAAPGIDRFDSEAVVDLLVDMDGNGTVGTPSLETPINDVGLTGPTNIQKFGQCDPDVDPINPPDCTAVANDTNGSGVLEAEDLPFAAPGPEPDNRGEIETEILSMELTGGGLTVRAGHIFSGEHSYGSIEEQSSVTDFPADSFFDMFTTLDGTPYGTLNNFDDPVRMRATISSIPPLMQDYTGLGPTDFKDAGGVIRVRVTVKTHTLIAPIGGTTELLVDASQASAGASERSGSSAPLYAAIAGAAAAVVAMISVGGWYARRRWLR